ncbi:hypothetical protein [Nonomuraea sp. SYSU D8015]|uniref:hypothetical protein n=1 Tax=Nonomuraea sp. SYSU D8015 TaxID=2593644 RepID=UPI00166060D9|nr:hypothetical protein [Nonomuraea sp. SYSU D8015]
MVGDAVLSRRMAHPGRQAAALTARVDVGVQAVHRLAVEGAGAAAHGESALARDKARAEKKLAQTEAALDIMGKVSLLEMIFARQGRRLGPRRA